MTAIFKLLQSGFIGEDTSDLIQIPEEERSVIQSVINQSLFRPDTSNFYDKGVNQLYLHMATDQNAFRDFRFRELILKKALTLFGEAGFATWIKSQATSPAYTYLHERFLKETVQYIYDSKPRSISNGSYFRMLHIGRNNPLFTATVQDTGEESLEKVLRCINNSLTTDLLSRWTESVDGIQDMLSTLNVIYGRRASSSS